MEQGKKQITFRINAPRVVYQTIENETIIIDFDNGAYYSADGVGAEIWEGIAGISLRIGLFTRCRSATRETKRKL